MNNNFSLSELNTVSTKFNQYFGLDIHNYIDNVLCLVTGHIIIDLCKFDSYISSVHNYPDGTSLQDCITENYGSEASKFIEKLI